jgi:hypothetical protein
MRHMIRCLAIPLLIAGLTACGDAGSEGAPEASQPASTDAAEPAAPAAEPMPENPQPLPPARARPPGDTASIVATIAEYSVRIEPDTIVAGDISLLLSNTGERPHTIEVRGDNGMRWVSLPIRPGGGLTMTMVIAPGRYVIRSTDAAYVNRGLTADFHVR